MRTPGARYADTMHNRAERAGGAVSRPDRAAVGRSGGGAGRTRPGRAARTVTLLAALLGAGSAAAQDQAACGGTPGAPAWARNAAYRGTLGGHPIALQLQLTPGRFESRYFYERRSLDITLEEFRSGEQLILQETVRRERGGDSVVTGCFTLMPTDSGLKGTWQAPGGRAQPVTLAAFDPLKTPLKAPDSPGLQRLRREDPLAFLKFNRAWVRTPTSVREPLSGLSYPRVANASGPLNAALQDRLLENAVSALDCRSLLPQDLQADPAAGYELRAALTLQKTRLVSLREDVYYECGGAHPDSFTLGVLLDRRTGASVPVTALWPKLSAARQKTLYLKAVSGSLEPDCREVLTERASRFTAYLSAAGLHLTPTDLPHVVAACADTAVLPYATLRAEANAASPYFADLYAR